MKTIFSGVYAFIKDDVPVYVGSSTNILRRQRAHLSLLRNNKHHSPYFQNAWNKYGESAFSFKVIELTDDLIAREQFYIDLYQPKYNYAAVAGSRIGVPQSPETIEKVRQVHLGAKRSEETRQKISEANKGKSMDTLRGKSRSPETIAKMKASMAARKAAGIKRERKPMSDETKRKISEAQKGKPRDYARGRIVSKETRDKIAARLIGNTNGKKK